MRAACLFLVISCLLYIYWVNRELIDIENEEEQNVKIMGGLEHQDENFANFQSSDISDHKLQMESDHLNKEKKQIKKQQEFVIKIYNFTQLIATLHQLLHEIGDDHDIESMTEQRQQ